MKWMWRCRGGRLSRCEGPQGQMGRKETLHRGADIARQHDRHSAVANLQDDRVVVADLLTFPVGKGRVSHVHLCAPETKTVAALQRSPPTALESAS